jgi:hypothetical protein
MSEVQTQRIYGWYDQPDQPIEHPTFNPSFPGPCLFCGKDTSEDDVRTHSLMPMISARSYFYRTHRTCSQSATTEQSRQIDGVVLDSIAHHGD